MELSRTGGNGRGGLGGGEGPNPCPAPPYLSNMRPHQNGKLQNYRTSSVDYCPGIARYCRLIN